jgi:F-type H+-transporting ATPase subunit delta
MLELIRGYASAAFDGAERQGRLGEVSTGLVELARLFVASEPLRTVFADGSIPASGRRAVLEDLLSGKIPEEALAPVTFAVETERASELGKTIERLVEIAELAVANAAAGEPFGAEPPAGRTGAYDRIGGFAERVFEKVAEPHVVDTIEDELFRLARIAQQSPELREALGDGSVPVARRLAVLADLVKDQVRPETLRLAQYVIRAGRSRDLPGALDHLVELAAADRGRRVAEVHSAVPLDSGERDRLARALTRIVRRPVELRVLIDPSVIGGVSIAVGNTIIDGTVRHRLDQLRESLTLGA